MHDAGIVALVPEPSLPRPTLNRQWLHPDGMAIAEGGSLSGVGTLVVDCDTAGLNNSGTVSPAAPSGTQPDAPNSLLVVGDYSQTSTGVFDVHIDSTSSCSQMTVAGTAHLDGTLKVNLGYTPNVGDRFPIMFHDGLEGRFTGVEGATIPDDPSKFLGLNYRDDRLEVITLETPVRRGSFGGGNTLVLVTHGWNDHANNAGGWVRMMVEAMAAKALQRIMQRLIGQPTYTGPVLPAYAREAAQIGREIGESLGISGFAAAGIDLSDTQHPPRSAQCGTWVIR